jgi:hypothetical protein
MTMELMCQKIRLRHIWLFVFASIFFVGCQSKTRNEERNLILRNNKGNPIFKGAIVNDSVPTSLWKFYDDSGSVFLSINFDTVSSKNSIEIIKYDDLIYDFELKYIDGKLIEEPIAIKNLKKGKRIFMLYLAGFDIFEKKLIQNREAMFTKLDSISLNNPNIPNFSDIEKEVIYNYLQVSSKPIPDSR